MQTSAGMQVAGLAGLSAAMGAPGAGVAPPGILVAPSRQQIAPPIPSTQQAADASGANAFANIGLANVPTAYRVRRLAPYRRKPPSRRRRRPYRRRVVP